MWDKISDSELVEKSHFENDEQAGRDFDKLKIGTTLAMYTKEGQ